METVNTHLPISIIACSRVMPRLPDGVWEMIDILFDEGTTSLFRLNELNNAMMKIIRNITQKIYLYNINDTILIIILK